MDFYSDSVHLILVTCFSTMLLPFLLLGIELPKCLVSEQEHSGFSCSLALVAVPLNFWQWNFYRQNLTPCSMALNKEALLLGMCLSARTSTLLLSRPSIFYICVCLELSVKDPLGSLFFPHLSSHIINVVYKLRSIIHFTFYVLIVGFSKARVWRSEIGHQPLGIWGSFKPCCISMCFW